jgi:hypothetical protein
MPRQISHTADLALEALVGRRVQARQYEGSLGLVAGCRGRVTAYRWSPKHGPVLTIATDTKGVRHVPAAAIPVAAKIIKNDRRRP